METSSNIISPRAKTSAIAGMMFFAPLVKKNINSDPILTPEDKKFIMWYVQVWYANLTFLLIVIVAVLLNLFRINPILPWVIAIWSFAIYIITVFCLFSCANGLSMWNENESIMQKIPQKGQLFKAFLPIINFIDRFRKNDYNMPYRWLKESTFLRTFFIFGTLLFGVSFGIGVLIIIAARLVMLLLNIDIIPLSMKKMINTHFSCVPGEMMSYISAPIITKVKKMDYENVLQTQKAKYAQWQNFWFWIILQYLLFGAILYLLYRNIDITLSTDQIILLATALLWLLRIIIFYANKKTFLRIPVISEIVWLVFN